MTKYFRLVITALDAHRPKQSPEALVSRAKQLGIQISECAAVDDSIIDVKAGRNVGARTVAVSSGIFTREELERETQDFILRRVNKLPHFLE